MPEAHLRATVELTVSWNGRMKGACDSTPESGKGARTATKRASKPAKVSSFALSCLCMSSVTGWR